MPQISSGPGTRAQIKRSGPDNGLRLAIALVIVSLVLFTASSREGEGGPLSMVRSGFQTVTMPVRAVGSLIGVPFQGMGNIMANLTADQKTLSELKAENAELTARLVELEEAQQTATRLQGLLDLQDTYSLKSTAARIISGSTDSWSDTVTIDKGSLAGIAVGMPVSDSAGVIGQTIECGPTSSVVRLLTDENSSVSAMLQQTRAQGMLNGSANGKAHLTLIGAEQTVEVGDIVVTSGLGGVFPKGLPIGRVSNVSRTSGALYLDIEVSLFSNPENFEEVLVITSLTEDQRATTEDIASANAQDTSASSGASSTSTSASDEESSEDTDESSEAASSDGSTDSDTSEW